jgi:hypothetical protein
VADSGRNYVIAFTIGADGALSPVEDHGQRPNGNRPSPGATGHQPAGITVAVPNRDPQLFVANYGSTSVSAFRTLPRFDFSTWAR